MNKGYAVVHRMTQAEYDAGSGLTVSGGFIQITDASGTPTGVMYLSGAYGDVPTVINGALISVRKAHQFIEHFRVVYDIDGIEADLSDPTDITKCETILGLTQVATSMGSDMELVSHGEIPLYSGLAPGAMYLGAGGTITQVLPTSGILVKLGYVANVNMMVIDIGQPIVLA